MLQRYDNSNPFVVHYQKEWTASLNWQELVCSVGDCIIIPAVYNITYTVVITYGMMVRDGVTVIPYMMNTQFFANNIGDI